MRQRKKRRHNYRLVSCLAALLLPQIRFSLRVIPDKEEILRFPVVIEHLIEYALAGQSDRQGVPVRRQDTCTPVPGVTGVKPSGIVPVRVKEDSLVQPPSAGIGADNGFYFPGGKVKLPDHRLVALRPDQLVVFVKGAGFLIGPVVNRASVRNMLENNVVNQPPVVLPVRIADMKPAMVMVILVNQLPVQDIREVNRLALRVVPDAQKETGSHGVYIPSVPEPCP